MLHAPITPEVSADHLLGVADAVELRMLFEQVTDPRMPRGVRHHVATVLTVMLFAVLTGAVNYREAGDRAADLPAVLLAAAGARRHPRTGALTAPSGSTMRRVLQLIDAQAADILVCMWIADRVPRRPEDDDRYGIAIDGKVVRNSGGPFDNVKLFSAMLHDEAVVVAQLRIPDDTNEITQVEALLDRIDVTGAVITGDAAHTQRHTADHISQRGADYVLTLKGNQPTLLRTVAAALSAASQPGHHSHIDRSHGRVVRRQIWTTNANGIDFPAAAQIFRIRRDVFDLAGHRVSKEIVHGITSLDTTQASAQDLAGWVRAHWSIENKLHYVRDVVFAEDDQHAYTGTSAHTMAMIRNLAIGLIRLAGHTQIKRTLQHLAADRTRILPLLAASRP